MMAAAVFLRELRAESRRPSGYWIRVVSAGAAFAWLVHGLIASVEEPNGRSLFLLLHPTIETILWWIAPLLTADCIGRERREGTLGLLFLTPLRVDAVVIGKSTGQLARGVIVWMAVVPFLAVPLLMGGLNTTSLALAAVSQACTLAQGLMAGLVVSAFTHRPFWAYPVALAVGQGVRLLYYTGAGAVAAVQIGIGLPPGTPAFPWREFGEIGAILPALPALPVLELARGFVPIIIPMGTAADWFAIAAALGLGTGLLVWIGLRVVEWRVKRIWREQPLSPRAMWWQRTFLVPRFWLEQLRRRQAVGIQRNPVAWLGERSAGGRLARWAWFAAIAFVGSLWLQEANLAAQTSIPDALASLLIAGMCLTAVTRFRSDRQSGLHELIFVTPLGPRLVARGRVLAIWRRFLPAVILLVVVWKVDISEETWKIIRQDPSVDGSILSYARAYMQAMSDSEGRFTAFVLGAFGAPIVGLCCAVFFRSVLVAAICSTCLETLSPARFYSILQLAIDFLDKVGVPLEGMAHVSESLITIGYGIQILSAVVCGLFLWRQGQHG